MKIQCKNIDKGEYVPLLSAQKFKLTTTFAVTVCYKLCTNTLHSQLQYATNYVQYTLHSQLQYATNYVQYTFQSQLPYATNYGQYTLQSQLQYATYYGEYTLQFQLQ